jgi:hypothetical protein
MLDPVRGRGDECLLLVALGLSGLEPVPLLGLGGDDMLELILVVELVVLVLVVLLDDVLVPLGIEVLLLGIEVFLLLGIEVLLVELFPLHFLVVDVLGEVVAQLVLLGLVGAGLLVAVAVAGFPVRAHAAAIPGKLFTKPSSACR